MKRHEMPVEIGFKHCDPAGIVFYPRYAEMVNDTVEHWFKHGLGVDFDCLHRVRGIAIPTVKLSFNFMSPSRLGEALTSTLRVVETGRSSVALAVEFAGQDGRPRLRAELTFVFVGMESMKSLEIPADLKRSIDGYRALAEPNPRQ
jgi:4-hydroxybenzoyl-CoA thioesterase